MDKRRFRQDRSKDHGLEITCLLCQKFTGSIEGLQTHCHEMHGVELSEQQLSKIVEFVEKKRKRKEKAEIVAQTLGKLTDGNGGVVEIGDQSTRKISGGDYGDVEGGDQSTEKIKFGNLGYGESGDQSTNRGDTERAGTLATEVGGGDCGDGEIVDQSTQKINGGNCGDVEIVDESTKKIRGGNRGDKERAGPSATKISGGDCGDVEIVNESTEKISSGNCVDLESVDQSNKIIKGGHCGEENGEGSAETLGLRTKKRDHSSEWIPMKKVKKPMKPKVVPCGLCDRMLSSWGFRTKHMKTQHGVESNISMDELRARAQKNHEY